MRIGLYGVPTAGKTYILEKIKFMPVLVGSKLLRERNTNFDNCDEIEKENTRKQVAKLLINENKSFIMDGHYSFGDKIAFTEEEGQMYDIYLYLYVSPEILKQRITTSLKNSSKYANFDIEQWQNKEILDLRQFCHQNNKDFYIIDNPKSHYDEEYTLLVLNFIKDIVLGYSCVSYAEKCANCIIQESKSDIVHLFDGDKSLTLEDTSKSIIAYKTDIFDNNFYTGFQIWKQYQEFNYYPLAQNIDISTIKYNEKVKNNLTANSFILSSGHKIIWEKISQYLGITYYGGIQLSAETKFFITKKLQEANKFVIAYGDSNNDYYMLKQANKGFLVRKADGSISKSLINQNLAGLNYV